ncbi:hypothetical protein AKO1_001807 [Acrasis kona]|uniref:Uncharacterized protein n=1 Tax=Acrasis kona TaxID=1008807 RepID=A0AAW2ZB21_9EUKA
MECKKQCSQSCFQKSGILPLSQDDLNRMVRPLLDDEQDDDDDEEGHKKPTSFKVNKQCSQCKSECKEKHAHYKCYASCADQRFCKYEDNVIPTNNS